MGNTGPKVSVIVPAYNAENFVERCLKSLFFQTFQDFEIILINDGSTDKTLYIAQQFKNQHTIPFYIYSQNNKGVSSARNFGLSKATGEWIVFLDADDVLPNDALEEFSKHCADDVDMIIGGYEVRNSGGETTYCIPERTKMKLCRNSAIKLMYEPLFYRYLGYIAGKCYRRSNIIKWGLLFCTNIFFNEDRLFTTQYLCNCQNILFFTKPVYFYYEHPASVMSSFQEQFNPKFMTDLKGFVEMKKSIQRANESAELLALADQGILWSYKRIKEQLNIFHENNTKRIIYLHKLLISGFGFCKYVQFMARVFLYKTTRR